MICKNITRHNGRRCGSHAINDDPERRLCDVCYAYRAGQEEMLSLLRAVRDCDGAGLAHGLCASCRVRIDEALAGHKGQEGGGQ
jgi:hypothetical protein